MTTHTLPGSLLWQPSDARIKNAGLTAFRDWVNASFETKHTDYQSLWQWSVEDISRFWQAIWDYYGVSSSTPYQKALSNPEMPGAEWFKGASLNMAEYLLKQGDLANLSRCAIFAESECFPPRQISWLELREQVVKMAQYLRTAGVKPGDRVVAYIPISIEATVAMLACMSIGAIWSSCSPDFGSKSVLERFQQITPKVFINVTAYQYNGKPYDRTDEVNEIINALPSVQQVIHLPWLDHQSPQPPHIVDEEVKQLVNWHQCFDNCASYNSFDFEQVDFSHPVWILYTSGTTGMPKGIVHSQGGALLELIKFAWLHDDLKPESVKFFYTSAGWTMFNMLVGGFASGSAIVVYDGCPTYPSNDCLWDISARCGVSYFGTSPTYINSLAAAHYSPSQDLSHISTFAMGGSPVSAENFAWVYENVGKDIHVFSMSGGTDVATAFVGQASTLPVRAGDIQCACLGVDVCAFDDAGNAVTHDDGELVIRQPMPSMPLYFWNDNDHSRYHNSYFNTFPGIWRQGDLAQFNEDGSCTISGRSDSTLNRYGIRIGTAEIYRNVECIEGINDSLIVNLELADGKFYMPLFISLEKGAELNTTMRKEIRSNLIQHCSPRHAPDEIIVIDAIPYTLTGKKQEIPIKKLMQGKSPDKAVNLGACANPEAMRFFIEQGAQLAEEYTN